MNISHNYVQSSSGDKLECNLSPCLTFLLRDIVFIKIIWSQLVMQTLDSSYHETGTKQSVKGWKTL